MDIEKKKKLDDKLRDMFNTEKQSQQNQVRRQTQPIISKVIRRRQGEQERRIPLAG